MQMINTFLWRDRERGKERECLAVLIILLEETGLLIRQLLLSLKKRAGAAASQGWHRVHPSQAAPLSQLPQGQSKQALSHICLHPEGRHTLNSASPNCYSSNLGIWGKSCRWCHSWKVPQREGYQVGHVLISPGFIWYMMTSDICNTVLGIYLWIQHLYYEL